MFFGPVTVNSVHNVIHKHLRFSAVQKSRVLVMAHVFFLLFTVNNALFLKKTSQVYCSLKEQLMTCINRC